MELKYRDIDQMARYNYRTGNADFLKPRPNKVGHRKGTITNNMLIYIKENGPTSKYDLITIVGKHQGSRKALRGHWSVNFDKLRQAGVLSLNYDTFEYHLTLQGAKIVYSRDEAPELYL